MSQHRPKKGLALYTDTETELWKEVEQVAREEHHAYNAREGEIVAQVFATYLGRDGPLNRGNSR